MVPTATALVATATALVATAATLVTATALVTTATALVTAATLVTTATALVATAATLVAAATLAFATAATVTDAHAVFTFEGVSGWAVRNRNFYATPAFEFKAFRARRRRGRNALATDKFKPMPTFGRRNFLATTALVFIACRAFGTVLVEAGAAAATPESAAATQGHRAAGAEDQKSKRNK